MELANFLHGEGGGADVHEINQALSEVKQKLQKFDPRDIFNADNLAFSTSWHQIVQWLYRHLLSAKSQRYALKCWSVPILMAQRNMSRY